MPWSAVDGAGVNVTRFVRGNKEVRAELAKSEEQVRGLEAKRESTSVEKGSVDGGKRVSKDGKSLKPEMVAVAMDAKNEAGEGDVEDQNFVSRR